ncbi:MAG: GNAT family N-acetyltransferase [Candidatus Thiodiazotropha sp. (ex Epidulcina cf. delphinae)]|nr:GNAT family N-acetyltransferase [Candidatus Thiodiazotropha sp. (ex Epidulcina cf. delphinae)]
MIEVRRSLADDSVEITRIVSLATQILRKTYCLKNVSESGSAKPQEKLASLVAIVNAKIVGVVEYKQDEDHIYFQGLAVDPSYHRQGIARKIIETLESMASESGRKKLKTATIEETGNVLVFERMGFRVASRKPAERFQSKDHAEVHIASMEKDIT